MKLDELTKQFIQADWDSVSKEELFEYIEKQGISPNFYQELEMSSSLVQTHLATSISSAPDLHSHNFYEILCCTNGRIEYLLGDRRVQVGVGDIVFLPPGAVHCPIYPEKMTDSYERYVIWASCHFIASLRQTFPHVNFLVQDPYVLHTAGTPWQNLTDSFIWGVQEAQRKEPGWELMVVSNATQLLVSMSRAHQELREVSAAPESADLHDQVLQYIQLHLSEKITLASTARHFLVCESTISQLFRKKMGQSFYRCVTQRRLVEAKNLIFGGAPLDQVAVQVGFQDYSSFYRAFRAEFGLSPGQYRKMIQN